MDQVLEISGFSKSYSRGVKAVEGLDLKVRKGVFLGFVGPNGAGKSTTVNYIAGLLKADEGSLTVLGDQVGSGSYKYRKEIGFLLEGEYYMERLTAREYLAFVGCMQGLDKSLATGRVEELVSFFDIADKKKQIRQYSAGMKKKVSLAAALIHDPEILILDEPFEGVDAVSSKQIKDNLLHMVKKGRTIILTSHVLDLVEKLCDEVAVIDKGRLIFQTETSKIREMFKDEALGEKFKDLEDLFISLVSDPDESTRLSWL